MLDLCQVVSWAGKDIDFSGILGTIPASFLSEVGKPHTRLAVYNQLTCP